MAVRRRDYRHQCLLWGSNDRDRLLPPAWLRRWSTVTIAANPDLRDHIAVITMPTWLTRGTTPNRNYWLPQEKEHEYNRTDAPFAASWSWPKMCRSQLFRPYYKFNHFPARDAEELEQQDTLGEKITRILLGTVQPVSKLSINFGKLENYLQFMKWEKNALNNLDFSAWKICTQKRK